MAQLGPVQLALDQFKQASKAKEDKLAKAEHLAEAQEEKRSWQQWQHIPTAWLTSKAVLQVNRGGKAAAKVHGSVSWYQRDGNSGLRKCLALEAEGHVATASR